MLVILCVTMVMPVVIMIMAILPLHAKPLSASSAASTQSISVNTCIRLVSTEESTFRTHSSDSPPM